MRAAENRRVQGRRSRVSSLALTGMFLVTGLLASGVASAEWEGLVEADYTPFQLSLIGGPTQIFKQPVKRPGFSGDSFT